MNNNPHVNIDFNLFSLAVICSLALAVSKLCFNVSISWMIVFMPMIILLGIDLVALLLFLVIALVIYLVHNKKGM